MAKKKEVKSGYINKEGRRLDLSPTFIYELSYYRMTPKSYQMIDSKTMRSAKYVDEKNRYTTAKDKSTLIESLVLVAAPIDWLDKNKFKLWEDKN